MKEAISQVPIVSEAHFFNVANANMHVMLRLIKSH